MLLQPSMGHYFCLHCENLKAEDEDLFSHFCFESGAAGTAESLDFAQSLEHFEGQIFEKSIKAFDVYFEQRPNENFLLQLQAEFPYLKTRVQQQENKDWMQEWKKGFQSFHLADGVWLVPSWLKAPLGEKKVISLDPGMAFGTGTHETTKLCAEILADFLQKESIQSLLDVGTGTGILSILASYFGVEQIEATEIDADARQVARDNAAKNSVSLIVHEKQIDFIDEKFDLVCANIIDGVLLQIQKDLLRCSKAFILVSGILLEREKEFCSEFCQELKILDRQQKGEWLALLLKKNA